MKNIQDIKVNSVIFVSASMGFGGSERVISELANNFSRNGIEVTILMVSGDNVDYSLDNEVILIGMNNRISSKNKILSFVQRIYYINKYVKLSNASVVISFLSVINIYTTLATLFLKKIVILSERNDPKKDPTNRIKRYVRNVAYSLANGVVFQTGEAMRYFNYKIQQKSIIITNPVKTDLPDSRKVKKINKISAVGRLEVQKNYPFLIKAFALVQKDYPDLKLEIFGDGNEKLNLLNLVSTLHLESKVLFLGTSKNVHDIILSSLLFILSSDYEGMPNSLMEAMAMGLPCISTNCSGGGPANLIEDKVNGILVSVGDIEELRQNIVTVITDKDLAYRISQNAMKIRDSYSVENISRKWIEYIELKALENRNRCTK